MMKSDGRKCRDVTHGKPDLLLTFKKEVLPKPYFPIHQSESTGQICLLEFLHSLIRFYDFMTGFKICGFTNFFAEIKNYTFVQDLRINGRGQRDVPFFNYQTMDKETLIKNITGEVESELADSPGYFLVEVKVTPRNDVKVYIDADEGASIDKLAAINRTLYRKVESEAWFGENGNFSMEVSSPGLDEPLKLWRQYRKNIHQTVEVLRGDGVKIEGVLQKVSEDGITLEQSTGNKKNKQIKEVHILFNQIKYTKVSVVF